MATHLETPGAVRWSMKGRVGTDNRQPAAAIRQREEPLLETLAMVLGALELRDRARRMRKRRKS